MSSEMLKAYKAVPTHAVGNLNNWKVKVVPYGAVVTTADVDNFTLVQYDGFNADGERQCKQLAAVATKGFLVASVEERFVDGEQLASFFNGVGDRARLVVLESGVTRFDTSAFEMNVVGNGGTAVTAVAVGMKAFFDPTKKKFIVCNSGAEATLYATAANKFEVVGVETDAAYGFIVDTVKLEAI